MTDTAHMDQTLSATIEGFSYDINELQPDLIGYYIVIEYEKKGKDRAQHGDKLIVNISKKLVSHIEGWSTLRNH